VCVSVCEGSVWMPGCIWPGPYLSVNVLCFAASPVEVLPPPQAVYDLDFSSWAYIFIKKRHKTGFLGKRPEVKKMLNKISEEYIWVPRFF
jgi:hypothetical protein